MSEKNILNNQLTAEPGTDEFLKQLLEIAQKSDNPIDKALSQILSKQVSEMESDGP